MKKRSLILLALCLVAASSALAQDSAQMSAEPRNIDIGALYNGTSLTATGSIPADSEAVIRFIGASCDLHMKERGRVGGIIWMGLDSLTFKGAPGVCLISSAVDLDRLAAAGDASVRPLKLSGLKDSVRIEANGGEHKGAFEEFLKLKQKEGLYKEILGNIRYGAVSDGQKTFHAVIPVPSRLFPGSYVLELVAVRNGEVIARVNQPVTVKLAGFPALLARLAFGFPALYGVLATIIALITGLVIGVVFQSRGAH
jgi:hypothetical protein